MKTANCLLAREVKVRDRPIKVLHVIHAFGMGGAETWLMALLRLWRGPSSPRMDFLVTSGERCVFDDEALALGAKIYYVQYGKHHILSFAKALRQILANESYDAIHDHQDYASGWHFLLGGRHLPPVRIAHIHNPAYQIRNNYGVTMSRRMATRIGKRLIRSYATCVAGTSAQVVREYGFDEDSFANILRRALYCGFDPILFSGDATGARRSVCSEFGWPTDVRILLFVGRTDVCPDLGAAQNHKNSGFAIHLAIEAAKRDASIRMIMCGASSDATPLLQSRINTAGFCGRVVMAGIRKDIQRFMLASDILLFPSRGEGLGMVAVEAQAAGLQVLASTAVPRECVVVDGMVRFLEVSDDLAPWLFTIEEILSAKKPDLVTCNLQVVDSVFSIANSAAQLEQLYTKDWVPAPPVMIAP